MVHFNFFVCLKKKKDSPPLFKNELILERNATMQQRPALETLKREALDLETQIRQLQVSFFYSRFFFTFVILMYYIRNQTLRIVYFFILFF